MSFIRGGETITIKRRSEASRDDYGNAVYETTVVTVKDALIAIGGTSEPVDPERDAIDATLTAYLPQGTTVLPGDIFVIRSTEWLKDGTAQEWISPFQMETGVIVPLRRRVG